MKRPELGVLKSSESGVVCAWEWAFAAVLVVLYAAVVFATVPLPRTARFGGDSWEYQSLAVNFATGHGLVFGGVLPFSDYAFDTARQPWLASYLDRGRLGGEEHFYRTPAYPVILGTVYWVAGVRPAVAGAVQLGWLVLVAAFLPALAQRLFGRGGYVAGLIGGPVFLAATARSAALILTEPLISVAVFLVLVTWVGVSRRGAGTWSGALFGLALAFALLVKGSLVFLPPLFLAYMLAQHLVKHRFSLKQLVACIACFLLPVAAWSAYASVRSHSVVILSTQARAVLLGGNNELAIKSGQWQPQWRDDPASFYSQRLRREPHAPTSRLVVGFYIAHPEALVVGSVNKLRSSFDSRWRAFFGVALAYSTGVLIGSLGGGRNARLVIALVAFVVLALTAARIASPLALLGATVGVTVVGLARWEFRAKVAVVWRSPGLAATTIVMANFILVVLSTFGNPRFIMPAVFVFAAFASLLTIRFVERLRLLEWAVLATSRRAPGPNGVSGGGC